jgi:hypothetical protein
MPPPSPTSKSALDKADYLWKEYQYRHDLVWRLIFRFTAAVVLISIVPYVQTEIAQDLGWVIVFVPILATFLGIFGIIVMRNELDLLDKIRREYRKLQNTLFVGLHDEKSKGHFRLFVLAYLFLLTLLSAANIGIVVGVWLPRIQPCH